MTDGLTSSQRGLERNGQGTDRTVVGRRRSAASRKRVLAMAVEALETRTMLSGVGVGFGTSQTDFGSIVPIVRETGRVSLSVDGLGTTAGSGLIQVNKPAGATVRGAYLAAASTGFSGRRL